MPEPGGLQTGSSYYVVENRRLADGRIARRQVLYLGEINASQRQAWRKTIALHEQGLCRQVALFAAQDISGHAVDAMTAS